MLAVEYTTNYGVYLVEVERDPAPTYREDVRDRMFRRTGDLKEELANLRLDNMPDRQPCDGSLPGCYNMIWLISAEEAEALRELAKTRTEKAEQRRAEEARLMESGSAPCPKCGSYCYGDCEAQENCR